MVVFRLRDGIQHGPIRQLSWSGSTIPSPGFAQLEVGAREALPAPRGGPPTAEGAQGRTGTLERPAGQCRPATGRTRSLRRGGTPPLTWIVADLPPPHVSFPCG